MKSQINLADLYPRYNICYKIFIKNVNSPLGPCHWNDLILLKRRLQIYLLINSGQVKSKIAKSEATTCLESAKQKQAEHHAR